MKESENSLANKTGVKNALDLGDKNKETIKKNVCFKLFLWYKSYFEDDEMQNYLAF